MFKFINAWTSGVLPEDPNVTSMIAPSVNAAVSANQFSNLVFHTAVCKMIENFCSTMLLWLCLPVEQGAEQQSLASA